MKYGWRRFSFDLPTELEDHSVLAFAEKKDGVVDINVTFTSSKLDGSLADFLAGTVEGTRKNLSGYKLVGQSDRRVAGVDAKVLEHSATSPDGKLLCLLQAFVPEGDDVAIVTVTGNGDSKARIEELFESFVGSLRTA